MVIKLHFIYGRIFVLFKQTCLSISYIAIVQYLVWFSGIFFIRFIYMQWLGTHSGKIYRGLVK